MAVTVEESGSISTAVNTTANWTAQAGVATDDLWIMGIVYNQPTVVPATPTGWTAFSNGTITVSASMEVKLFWKWGVTGDSSTAQGWPGAQWTVSTRKAIAWQRFRGVDKTRWNAMTDAQRLATASTTAAVTSLAVPALAVGGGFNYVTGSLWFERSSSPNSSGTLGVPSGYSAAVTPGNAFTTSGSGIDNGAAARNLTSQASSVGSGSWTFTTGGGYAATTFAIPIAAGNAAPTANAGTDQTGITPSSTVTLHGSGSDTDGTISSYAWTHISGPSSVGALSSASVASPTYTAPATGGAVDVWRLTVTDNLGATGFDDVSITNSNSAPTANAGPDQTAVAVSTTVTLSGSGSDTDGTIASYAWSKVSGPTAVGALSSASVASPTYTAPATAATDVWRLTVTDNAGATGTDTVSITTIVNAAPTANAGPDQTNIEPFSTVTLAGSASDSDGTVASKVWSHVSGPGTTALLSSTTSLTPTYKATPTTGAAQTDVWRLTVTDNLGSVSTDDVSIAMLAPTETKIVSTGPLVETPVEVKIL